MLSDRDALLAAIRANPDEDTPRLMFADWLDEHGEPERAEFIRLQCEADRLSDDGSDSQTLYEFLVDRDYVTRPAADWAKIDAGVHRRVALAERIDALARAHGKGWTPRLPKAAGARWDGFRRGFPYRLEATDFERVAGHAEPLRGAAPAAALVAGEFTPRAVERLADAGLLGWVDGLEVSGDSSGLRELGHRPEAAGVRSLRVTGGDQRAVADALADSPHWTGLRSLDLTDTLSASSAEPLFYAKHLLPLRRLSLSRHDMTPDGVRVLAASGFRDLVSLSLTGCGLTDDAAEALAACPGLASLRTLDLGYNRLTGRGATALLCSPHLASVAFLGLEANPCTGLDAKRLAEAAPGGLRMLHCHGTRFTTADVRALAGCPRLRTLWYLDLDANGVGTPAVRALVRGWKDFCPPVVWMTHNAIDDRGLELLAKWKAASAMRVLHLRYNAATDAGVRALLDSPHLTGLDDLGVSNASDETTARLKARFKHYGTGYR